MRWLMREWRGGELRLLAVALIVAVAIVSGITAFTDRLHRGIVAESHSFLAADRVLLSPRPVPDKWLAEASWRGLRQAQVVDFQSMVFAGEQMQLAGIKAVSSTYPLKGRLRVSDRPFADDYEIERGPRPGELWLDSRLYPLLQLEPGDSLSLGDMQRPATRALVSEPDRSNSYYGVGPRVLMHLDDLAASGVVQPGSLVQYRYLFAGDEAALTAFGTWLAPKLSPSHRWQDLRDSQPQIASTLARAEQFLLLAGSFGVALAGVAVALAARRYSERHYDVVAVLKAMGASSGRVLRLYLGNLALLTALTALIGCALGWAVQAGLMAAIADLVGFQAPAPGWRAPLAGLVTALVCVAAFALPPILALQNVSPLRVLRRDFAVESLSLGASAALGLAGLGGLMWWYTGELQMALAVIAGVVVMLSMSSLLVVFLIRSGRRLGMQAGSSLRLALAALNRRSRSNAFQVVSFALALMVLLCLVVVRGSLLKDWQLQLPERTPNHFLINIQPDHVEPLRTLLAQRDIADAGLYPMVRGRLTHIDGQPLAALAHIDPSDRSFNRELNLSWAETLPSDNRVLDGRWWPVAGQAGIAPVSLESGFAERLGVGLGSQLTFSVGGLVLQAEVASIRELDWNTMQPNFFLLFPPGLLEAYPATYITSFYLPAAQREFLNELVRAFPTATLIEMEAVIRQLRVIVDRVSAAIELVLALVVLCALLVTVANVQASLDSRLHENAILRAMGASRRLIAGSLLLEFSALGAIAGALAAGGAQLSLYLLQTQVLKMEFAADAWLWLLSPPLGALLIAAAGWWSCRAVVETPPLRVLRGLS